MAHDPPAPTLGALDPAVKRLHDAANDPTYSSPRVRRADVQAVVRLVDAQATRLAVVNPIVAAARELFALTGPHPDAETLQVWLDEVHALGDAVANLAAPPGEG